MLTRGPLLLHDNAPVHMSRIAQAVVKNIGFQQLSHPPYSPDLAPSDFYLFDNSDCLLSKKRTELVNPNWWSMSYFFTWVASSTVCLSLSAWSSSAKTRFFPQSGLFVNMHMWHCIQTVQSYLKKRIERTVEDILGIFTAMDESAVLSHLQLGQSSTHNPRITAVHLDSHPF